MVDPVERLRNAMPGTILPHISRELQHDATKLNAACQSRWGISATMFRTVKFLFYIVTLAFSAYLIQFVGVNALLVMGFAAMLITGPEGVEALLIRQDVLADPDSEE